MGNTIDLFTTLSHGLLICLPFSLFVLVTFLWRPRLWLHSLPSDIQQKAGPKTEAEKKITQNLLLPLFLTILPGLSTASVFYLDWTTSIDFSLMSILFHLYGIWLTVHLWDLLIIDLGFVVWIDPSHPPIPGTEGAKGWKDLSFHFRSFLKATVISAIFVVPISVLLSIIL
jgi:hypothetical protein